MLLDPGVDAASRDPEPMAIREVITKARVHVGLERSFLLMPLLYKVVVSEL